MQRIEICGAIASGKTTILKGIENNNKVFEDFSAVPCLQDFYLDMQTFSFETEFYFTLQHYYQIHKAMIGINGLVISDFSLAQDYAYAKTTLKPNEFECYQNMHSIILEKIGLPDMIFFLKTSPEVLINRIKNRSRDSEDLITPDYLSNTVGNLEEAINDIYQDIPVYIVDTENNNVESCSAHINSIIRTNGHGR